MNGQAKTEDGAVALARACVEIVRTMTNPLAMELGARKIERLCQRELEAAASLPAFDTKAVLEATHAMAHEGNELREWTACGDNANQEEGSLDADILIACAVAARDALVYAQQLLSDTPEAKAHITNIIDAVEALTRNGEVARG